MYRYSYIHVYLYIQFWQFLRIFLFKQNHSVYSLWRKLKAFCLKVVFFFLIYTYLIQISFPSCNVSFEHLSQSSGNKIKQLHVQSTLVISTSVISNNRLSRRESLVLVLTWKSKIRWQNIVEKRRNCSPFSQYFQYIFLIKGVKWHTHL